MAKLFRAVAVFAAALCFSSFLSSASAHDDYIYVEGKVYCDVCRVEFETPISVGLSDEVMIIVYMNEYEYDVGATVNLECRNQENDTLTYSLKGKTDSNGIYSLPVKGDHEEDICEVKLVKSPREDCNEVFKSAHSAKVVVSKNMGAVEPVRFANALGFMQKEVNPNCGKILRSMGFLPALTSTTTFVKATSKFTTITSSKPITTTFQSSTTTTTIRPISSKITSIASINST
ncbi:unnamed protein product [Dovyalis caffra]|uniref:Olee1-like protein n=1 Tax=Dovyalis caffra TaxID=77055 RepID=A0AAV1SV08_9ROSI|nr:unnamed protein product [Dovyalis caffra]